MQQAYIINGVRTAIGNFGGTLSTVRTDDLATLVLKELMSKNPSVDFSKVVDVIMGCANQAGEDNRNVARMASLMAGLIISISSLPINPSSPACGFKANTAIRGLSTPKSFCKLL